MRELSDRLVQARRYSNEYYECVKKIPKNGLLPAIENGSLSKDFFDLANNFPFFDFVILDSIRCVVGEPPTGGAKLVLIGRDAENRSWMLNQADKYQESSLLCNEWVKKWERDARRQ